MIKILCFPLTKLALFITGFLGLASALRTRSVTFDAVFRTTDWLNEFMMLGFIPGIIILTVSLALLLFAVWKTKKKNQNEIFLRIWRSIDGILLVLFSAYIVINLLITAYNGWREFGVILLMLIAYALAVLVASEIIARLRDKELINTLYWVRFFRTHPIWRPLSFLLAILVAANLFMIVIFSHEVGNYFGLRAFSYLLRISFVHDAHWERPGFDLGNTMVILAAITLTALTYYMKYLLDVEARFARANEEKLRTERFKSELITNVSHDIRTPLTSIINYVDLLKALPLENEAEEYVDVLVKKSERLKILIDDLMEASKAGTGNVQLELQEVNIAELIGQIAGEFDEQYISHNLTLVLRGTEEAVTVQSDSRYIWRVMENIFSNTIKYSLPGTRVFAELEAVDNTVLFTLKNTSLAPIDVPAESLSEQFIRGDRSRKSTGSGLGLYIAKNLAELMTCTFNIKASGDLFEIKITFPPPL